MSIDGFIQYSVFLAFVIVQATSAHTGAVRVHEVHARDKRGM